MGEGATGTPISDIPDEEILVKQIEDLKESTENINNLLDLMITSNVYDKLSTEDKVKHDLFVSYGLTSLYWMYMRAQGENPTTHVVKSEIERIQDYVKKFQRVKDRKKRPTVEKAAAKRFVKSGLWDPSVGTPKPNKRKKISDDEED